MRVRDFSLEIKGGKHTDSDYVEMEHGDKYKLVLDSFSGRDTDAEIRIDGMLVGKFRLQRHHRMVLERGAEDKGCFTFYKAGTSDATKAGLGSVSKDEMGLIQVRFRPEKRREREVPTSGGINIPVDREDTPNMAEASKGCVPISARGDEQKISSPLRSRGSNRGISGQSMGFAAGGTGLSGKSDQTFTTVPDLDYDPAEEVTISLRLVCNDEPRPKVEAREASANTVPEPV